MNPKDQLPLPLDVPDVSRNTTYRLIKLTGTQAKGSIIQDGTTALNETINTYFNPTNELREDRKNAPSTSSN